MTYLRIPNTFTNILIAGCSQKIIPFSSFNQTHPTIYLQHMHNNSCCTFLAVLLCWLPLSETSGAWTLYCSSSAFPFSALLVTGPIPALAIVRFIAKATLWQKSTQNFPVPRVIIIVKPVPSSVALHYSHLMYTDVSVSTSIVIWVQNSKCNTAKPNGVFFRVKLMHTRDV